MQYPNEQLAVCSACHRNDRQVEVVILFSYAGICSECIELCNRILEGYRENKKSETTSPGADEEARQDDGRKNVIIVGHPGVPGAVVEEARKRGKQSQGALVLDVQQSEASSRSETAGAQGSA